jgi:hypothetical protein
MGVFEDYVDCGERPRLEVERTVITMQASSC